MVRKKISPISLNAISIMQQVRRRDISATDGMMLLQELAQDCKTESDISFIHVAGESISEFEERWKNIPDIGLSQSHEGEKPVVQMG